MKKLLTIISPVWVLIFILMWISWGLKGALMFFGIVLFTAASTFGLVKWIEFVDKHIVD